MKNLLTAFALVALSTYASGQTRYAYVPNAADGTVSAIELGADRVAWTVKIGERAAHGVAASLDGGTMYAADSAEGEVIVIDAARQAVVKRIPVPFPVHGIDLSPDGGTLWAGGQAGNDPVRGTLAVIETASGTVKAVVSPNLGAASHFAFTPDGSEVWIASTSTNLVWIVETRTQRVAAAIPPSLPEGEQRATPRDDWGSYLEERKLIGLNEVAVSRDGRTAYAVGPATSERVAIDVKGRRVLKTIHPGERAHGVTVSPDGRELWIADWSGVVSVFDSESLSLLARIPVVREGTRAPAPIMSPSRPTVRAPT